MQANQAQRRGEAAGQGTDPRTKLKAIEGELNASVLERKEEIRSLLLALVAGEHLLLLGSPGTAKSALARALCDRIDGGSYFSVLLTRHATPALVFGPDRLSALKEDRYEQNTRGMLPEATVAFIDEIFKCLAGDTLVVLPDGRRRRIDSFSDADLPVLRAAEGSALTEDAAVRFVRRPPELLYKLTLASGKQIRATADHRFLARGPATREGGRWKDWSEAEWTELSLLKRGAYVATPVRLDVEGRSEMPPHEVDLAALLIADGGCTQPQIRYTKADPALVALARERVGGAGDELVAIGERDAYRCRGTNVRRLVRRFGLDVTSPKKRVPGEIFGLGNGQLARFVGVLFSGDGYVNPANGHITYATSSKGLADDLQHLLLRFAVTSDITRFETTGGATDQKRTAYRLRVRKISAARFVQAFGAEMVGKQAEALRRVDTTVKTSARRNRVEGDVFWDKVLSVEPDRIEPTYCFETTGGNFVAGDVLVHNCNSSVLNGMLPILNEGLYKNGTAWQRVPLEMCVAASNEMPEDREELGALYDRFLVRHLVEPVRDDRNFEAILLRKTRAASGPKTGISLQEIRAARAEAQNVDLSAVAPQVTAVRHALAEEGIEPSVRRFDKGGDLVRASAYLAGRASATEEDLAPLAHALWEDPEHIPVVRDAILSRANPFLKDAQDLADEADEVAAGALSADELERSAKGAEANRKLKGIQDKLLELRTRAQSSGRSTGAIDEAFTKVKDKNKEVLHRCLGLDT